MPDAYFPLRWESTGDQWWYASPIDLAAANGHYDIVSRLLRLDANLLIKLTSLRRIRRLETVWDDDPRFAGAAKCRAFVARNLLLECESKTRGNTLIRSRYGGWLLYTAASAGDIEFVRELLARDPVMVFGEGEYGVTDILYAAARSRDSEVFKLLLGFAISPRCLQDDDARGGIEEGRLISDDFSVFGREMVNRAVHCAARGGNLEILRQLLDNCSDVLAYRDAQGCTILHSAAGRGQVEVVKDLVASFEIIDSRDNLGNTALHVASFRGHLSVVEALLKVSPSLSTSGNNSGDTFLHMAVARFKMPGFHRLDKQMDLMKQLVHGDIIDIREVISIRNNEGRTALQVAVIGNMCLDLVDLMMSVWSAGMPASDFLHQHEGLAFSETLTRQLISAGGISNSKDLTARSAMVSQLKTQGMGTCPGASFKISDAEIFLYAEIESPRVDRGSGRPSSCSSVYSGNYAENQETPNGKEKNSVNRAARRMRILPRWPLKREKHETPKRLDASGLLKSLRRLSECEDTPTPLRECLSRGTSLLNNKRTLSVQNRMASPASKEKFVTGLMRGLIDYMPHLAPQAHSLSSLSCIADKEKRICMENKTGEICSDSCAHKSRKSVDAKTMNTCSCFGAQDHVEDAINRQRTTILPASRLSILSAA